MAPTDMLGRVLKVGDTIAYPVTAAGESSAHMAVGEVVDFAAGQLRGQSRVVVLVRVYLAGDTRTRHHTRLPGAPKPTPRRLLRWERCVRVDTRVPA